LLRCVDVQLRTPIHKVNLWEFKWTVAIPYTQSVITALLRAILHKCTKM